MKSALDGLAASVNQYACWCGCVLFLLPGVCTCVMGAAADTPGSFESFQIIAERNIFAPTKASGRPAESDQPSRLPQDSLVLTGTMSYEKGQFAFFDGSNPDFKKALKAGDRIGGCTLTEIAFKQVKLKAGEVEFELPVGTRLLRENGGPWRLGGKADIISPPVEIAAQKIQSPDSTRSGKATKEDKTFEADPDKYSRWVEKKFEKYVAGMDPLVKEDKQASKFLKAFSADAPKKPKKTHKYDEG